MKQARLQTAVRLNKAVSQAAMAQLVGEELGEVLYQTQWSRYESSDSEPPLRVIRATARVSGLSEGYIAFGTLPMEAPAPSPAEILKQAMDAAGGAPRAEVEREDVPAADPRQKRNAEPESA